jgi:dipeptidyl aminopeptidase/acylaminoacyl peptidase
MTTRDGFTRLLDTWLAEEGVITTPDYLGDVLQRTTATRQRPVWASPGRWFPMLDVAVRPVAAPRLPVRALVTSLVILALLAAALAIVGSRSRVPAPFGPARNGLVTWALDGDIFVGDPAGGPTRRIVASDDIDRNPLFSRDGTQIAFLRQVPSETGRFDVMVTDAEGGSTRSVSSVPVSTPELVEWAPDGRSLLVNEPDGRLTRLFVDGSPAQLVLERVHIAPGAFRPPDGSQLLYAREEDPGALYRIDADGSDARPLFAPLTAPCKCSLAGPASWSPDGRWVAFAVAVDDVQTQIFVADADGGGLRQVANEPGRWVQNDAHWSPDGTRIAFNRWEIDDAGNWNARAIGVVDVATGALTPVGIGPASEGALIEWAPDGKSILSLPWTVKEGFSWSPGAPGTIARPTVIDLRDGSTRQIDWSVGSSGSWQRLAP